MNKYIWLMLLSGILAGCNEGEDLGSGSIPDNVEIPKIPAAPVIPDEPEEEVEEPAEPEEEVEEPVVVTIEENEAGFCNIDGFIESNHEGFEGDGFSNVVNAVDSSITWQVVAEADGDYDINIIYAAPTDRAGTINSNGADVELAFTTSTAWDVWAEQTGTISLKAGANDIVISSNTAEGMPNIDSFTITGVGLSAGTCTYTPPVVEVPDTEVQLFVVGDSTVANYNASSYPQAGWGQVLQYYFEEDEIEIVNKAIGGRSSRSFIEEERWNDVLSEVGEGDYVMIQFGHNDRDRSKAERYTPPADFETYIAQYVNETREKGATPILVSPMVMNAYRNGVLRNVFTEDGSDYAVSMAKVAADMDAAYIDLNAKSWELVNSLGQEQASHYLYLILDAGEYANYPDGSADGTHFQESGAVEMARLVVEGLEQLNANTDLTTLIEGLEPRYQLTVEQEGATNSLYTQGNSYPADIPLTFKVRAGEGDTFNAWYNAGTVASDTNLYQTTMPAGKFAMVAAFNGVVPTYTPPAATAYLIGDSTVANYADGYYPQTGWGQVFQHYLDDAKITVDNRALGGRSSKSFYNDHWTDVKANITEGDYVFIQFGINDRASDEDRKAPTGGKTEGFFEFYMTNFVEESRELGAIPIFVTTVRRNDWQAGVPYDAYHEHPVVTRQLATDLNVPLIDLNAKNKALLELVGENYANEFYYMGFGANQYGNATAEDDTVHFQKQGAVEMARLVAEGIKELDGTATVAPLISALKPTYSMSVSSPTPAAGVYTTAFEYPAGTPFTLKALANEADEFTQWLDDNRAEVSTAYLYEFDTQDMETKYEAVFNNSEGLGSIMTNLTTELDGTDIVLNWSLENFAGEITYVEVYRNEVAEINSDRVRVFSSSTSSGTYTDDTAEEGKTYWYMFKVVHGAETTNTDPEGEIRKPFVNEVPVTNLTTKVVYGSLIEVSWDLQYFDPEVTYLELIRNDKPEDGGRSRVAAGAPLTGTLVDDAVEPGKTYWYTFKIIQGGVTGGTGYEGEISISADAVLTPPEEGLIPGPLIDLEKPIVSNIATSLNDDGKVVVTWDLENVQEGTAVELMRNNKPEAGGRTSVLRTSDLTGSFVDDGAVSGETYWYMFKLTKDLKTKDTGVEGEITVP
ncbi:GDSL-type esterase/lipase family protein [Catenovulum sp. 2E275]|uniref:GDSL-type esterase/lipase family protein n=1 Tax=Catenovulum sp. 2E275 TaxID=2980497 RepID=UPI0021D250A9|nr:GDSL-type esterase/lipase family protein [Catenovulum sp. 2E275]MCU4674120.1 GDSL-type esterase/lipase family protein [Catenovulum sp. 2E275]